MWRLGWQLRTGDGVPRSEAEAVQWFGKGAQQGDARSEAALGQGYMSGLGGRVDYRAAAYWYERAASKGEESALINLGALYENGWGVPRDPQRARALYVQASRSPEPYYARAARERLGGSPSGGGSNADAALGAALVGLLLYSAFSGGGSGGGGRGRQQQHVDGEWRQPDAVGQRLVDDGRHAIADEDVHADERQHDADPSRRSRVRGDREPALTLPVDRNGRFRWPRIPRASTSAEGALDFDAGRDVRLGRVQRDHRQLWVAC
jgi:hypothetical protein